MSDWNRREFLNFIGTSVFGVSGASTLLSCTNRDKLTYKGIAPDMTDELTLAEGLQYDLLISYGDPINQKDFFGFNNDYINWIELKKDELLLWVNHEYFTSNFIKGEQRTKENIDAERKVIGGSILHLKKSKGSWQLIKNSKYNRRIDGLTKIPFQGNVAVMGKNYAIGSFGNCAGGKTPWNTILTCEENYQFFYGERKDDGSIESGWYQWEKFYPLPPEHYGWVVEVDLKTGDAQKIVTLGRFAHECATCTLSQKKGNVVVYSGDDKNDEHLYKFISTNSDNFDEGTLYVANLQEGRWISLDYNSSDILKKNFKSQLDVNIHARKASKLLGATALARPEDIEIHPKTGDVFIALTNNKPRNNFHGSILKITQDDHNDLSFQSHEFAVGGNQAGFSCPDNLCFDRNGNLWMTSDISGSSIGNSTYKKFGNNGLFVFPIAGKDKGRAIQIASAPKDAEFTGPCFSPDYQELFLSVQHPGERTQDLNNPTSHWPNNSKIPKPSVVVLTGKLIEKLNS
jgi:secreted PhoX family phosphatase